MRIHCPHCASVAHIRTSRPVSRFTRELYCQCSNLACGHTFVALTEVVRTLSPSNTPDPEVAQQLAARSTLGAELTQCLGTSGHLTPTPVSPA
ncbi:ogr/Delta-like zinc finger family protein [Ralstonia solanacearum]|uniref:ogr/Delta-like zinc finger family protein n=1 Tax=Ralstonia solanacearum TaxID=305 RepID=UPI0009E91CF7|nr:ogr/Delta-like zinc finger family protein [Ralstonia solanacearum]AXV85631.1 transcriptional regulator [Ralstonia solanacearum]AXW05140.1 transcriptional regulator [Ralstonia solanacearum]AXW22884.1 transcriptional regulator [Ralstonia solanacearum]AXW79831.1 transcriptional regulator [Ralstonia solanacearum]